MNETVQIVANNGGFSGQFWDLDFHCVYREFNGTFEGDEYEYYPKDTASWVEGRSLLRHNESRDWDLHLRDCRVIVDEIEYQVGFEGHLIIPEGETAVVTVQGSGNLRVDSGFHPHINGTLTIENFLRVDGLWSDEYERIRFDGNDIRVRTTQESRYTSGGGPFSSFDQWGIEISVHQGTNVEITEPGKLPLWTVYIMLGVSVVLFVITIREVKMARRPQMAK